MSTNFDNKFVCNNCGGFNKPEVIDSINYQICECKTKCSVCGFNDYWAYGFFESRLYMNNNLPFLLNEKELSKWCYWYCKYVNDDPMIRKNIKSSNFSFLYCKDVKDDPEIRENITESYWAYCYCLKINDDPEVRKYITDSGWAYFYCKNINDYPEIRKYIKNKYLLKKLKNGK